MSKKLAAKSSELHLTIVPTFWPMAMAASLAEEGAELHAKNLNSSMRRSGSTRSYSRSWQRRTRCGSTCAP